MVIATVVIFVVILPLVITLALVLRTLR